MRKKREGLPPKEKIAVLGVMLLGREYLPDAFAMSHNINTKEEASLKTMQRRWYSSQLAKDFRKEMTDRLAGVVMDTMKESNLTDDQLLSIIQRGIIIQRDSKDASSMAFKLMEWRKKSQAESPDREKRVYFLPWVSACRHCQLMKVYMKAQKDAKENKRS